MKSKIKYLVAWTLILVIAFSFSGCNFLLTVPGKPRNFRAIAGDGEVKLSWIEPDLTTPVNRYEVMYISTDSNSEHMQEWMLSSFTAEHTFTGLTNDIKYIFKVRAVNTNGNGKAAEITATPTAIVVTNEWTNDNAVYATLGIRTEFIDINEFAKNIETTFDTLDFKTIYVVEKLEQIPWASSILGHLKLLFVLNESGRESQDEFIELLHAYDGADGDWGVMDACRCYDVPYTDSRSLDAPKDTISVGETLTITFNGNLWPYLPPFDLGSVYVTLSDYDAEKTYTLADFPDAGFASVTKWEGYDIFFIFELAEPNYFNIIKAIDFLSRFLDAKTIELSYIYYDLALPIWEISDRTIVDFVDYGHDHLDVEGYYCPYCDGRIRIIEGLKAGTVTVSFCGVNFEVTVLSKLHEADLVAKYGLSITLNIWNDYEPPVIPNANSHCVVDIIMPVPDVEGYIVPQFEISAVVITTRVTIQIDEFVWLDGLRPVQGFRLNDDEEYTLYLTLKCRGETQTIPITGTVFTTH